jgi:hypothetical protein
MKRCGVIIPRLEETIPVHVEAEKNIKIVAEENKNCHLQFLSTR